MMRLNKFISSSGFCSRRTADQFIKNKKVMVNNVKTLDPGCPIHPQKDQVKVNGKILKICQNKIYIAFNKPKKILTTMKDPKGRICISDYFKKTKKNSVFPVGRLDWNSEGLMILTNDGDFAEKVLQPKHKTPKTYLVKLSGRPSRKQLERLRKGVSTQRGRFKALYAQAIKSKKLRKNSSSASWIKIIIDEGKNRQLHYMFQSLGFSIKTLRRTAIGRLKLRSLKAGGAYQLGAADIKKVFSIPSEIK